MAHISVAIGDNVGRKKQRHVFHEAQVSSGRDAAHPSRQTSVSTLAEMVTAFDAVRAFEGTCASVSARSTAWKRSRRRADGVRRELGCALCANSGVWHASMLPSARCCCMLLVSVVSFALLLPSSGHPVLPPSNLHVSNFQYTSLNASWEGPTSSASYDLRWRPMGSQEWQGGREIPAPVLSFEITGSIPCF